MKKIVFAFVVIVAAGVAVPAADEHKEGHKKKAGKHAGLELFKQLAGEWTGKEMSGGKANFDVKIIYKVTSNGSAVVETMDPKGEHEMVTVIHQDGKDLALTHYCAIGNQPHMKTDGKGDGKTFAFKFTGASNMKSDKDMHMHNVTYTFVDKDSLKAEWTNYMDGKPGGKVLFVLKRKKE